MILVFEIMYFFSILYSLYTSLLLPGLLNKDLDSRYSWLITDLDENDEIWITVTVKIFWNKWWLLC